MILLRIFQILKLVPDPEICGKNLTLKVFPGRRDVGHDVGDDAEDGCKRDQAHDQLKYHIQVFGPKTNSIKLVN